jgi:hypothetical protein
MEFTRNRQQHDQTAKQWTDLYAKPPPPPAPLPNAKKKAPMAVAEGSTSRRVVDRPQQSETITIDDSDEEGSGAVLLPPATNGKGKKRKREVGVVADEVELIGDEDAEVDDHLKGKRTRAVDGSRSKRDRTSGHGVDTAQRPMGDVIVIDD